ncbi:unnamed protein product [Triticum turgidum subsp. durum]|uniref:AB hydrolase-1 domain-containing protein n=1 Tax=Triticum turgidum subsp. durum TaxID=4567 RepID=A0A9R0SET5_TRITD|nr:unnamed protein product [Triticum turgidum subsp. durum]
MEAALDSGAKVKHIILVHGVCHGGWSWYKVAAGLRSAAAAAGHAYRVHAPDLAASGIDDRRLPEVATFSEYTGPLLDALRSLPAGEKAVLVGHSLGGLSVALATEMFPDKVAVAAFLSAYMPDCVSPPSHVLMQARSYNRQPNLQQSKRYNGKHWKAYSLQPPQAPNELQLAKAKHSTLRSYVTETEQHNRT